MPITTRVRCFRVEIETPMDDTKKRIRYHREAILEDENGTFLGYAKEQPSAISVPFIPDAAYVVRAVNDPVTQQLVASSGAGVAAWITADYDARLEAEAAAQALAAAPAPE
jgi:hypothetical protein